ncbi:hypothetical protein FVE85_4247 [Porphyridium purpureum]|uniref:Uncharacterized protein n=1 Tax=Porphyridium purpureum TaxID=35688 RepID=A0A5J4YTV6_PORPP|nr:Chain 2H, LRC4 [Porphyridium purpureum]6KGX_ZH Chain ZH, LRC4 [Porphyridium purpureum]7EZX_2P Chain 2P, Lrc4 [Porphyridium purpureum]7EZX_ZP Chain ZP, Lrc4 [Porphyridium purpureum]7Y4L_23 Chain 23, Lrc4 [Porphyridium purpureum]7Y4L_Z3 Chain Z3, Lrc4 [Porphyridium purpureum]7Y5E_23 Chain 23, Lrc4 [Porphyridium purpureum]7Y5E_Z3 Chain Z3, Lrc4 [Porphyridium purpureum]7Y7A_2B Chain 2B, Lrc4 [Porphyridium purpureum]7Y7A_2d Chain 2d, Lrc4 [Porphyridium purpureum]7Y7A_ZB Chain ZB, Lrc4 [Porp|eukprot:POR7198..scf229_5
MAFVACGPLRAGEGGARLGARKAACSMQLAPPGIPPGEDARNNQSLRQYVARPVETYQKRSFATPLPLTWTGETETVGAFDVVVPPQEKDLPVSGEATSAFVKYSDMVRAERKAALQALLSASAAGEGRPTCGAEGRKFVSNANPVLVNGVKCVEYWRK